MTKYDNGKINHRKGISYHRQHHVTNSQSLYINFYDSPLLLGPVLHNGANVHIDSLEIKTFSLVSRIKDLEAESHVHTLNYRIASITSLTVRAFTSTFTIVSCATPRTYHQATTKTNKLAIIVLESADPYLPDRFEFKHTSLLN